MQLKFNLFYYTYFVYVFKKKLNGNSLARKKYTGVLSKNVWVGLKIWILPQPIYISIKPPNVQNNIAKLFMVEQNMQIKLSMAI